MKSRHEHWIETGAVFRDDLPGRHRLLLWRMWRSGPGALWVMMNPSVANEHELDHTLRVVFGFSNDIGCGSFTIFNLWTIVETFSNELAKMAKDAIQLTHPGADPELARALEAGGVQGQKRLVPIMRCIAAWGAPPHTSLCDDHSARIAAVRAIVEPHMPIECLGLTKDGHPRHPSRLSRTTRPQPWKPPQPSETNPA